MQDVDPKNRLNDLNSRQWLQFQKSWFLLSDTPVNEFVRFFTKAKYPDGHTGTLALFPQTLSAAIASEVLSSRRLADAIDVGAAAELDYAFVDLDKILAQPFDDTAWNDALRLIERLIGRLRPEAYLTVVARNWRFDFGTVTTAWQVAKHIAQAAAMKDEKIGCIVETMQPPKHGVDGPWVPDDTIIYFMNFRKEKNSETQEPGRFAVAEYVGQKPVLHHGAGDAGFREGWFVHKPPPRPKNVLLHPAKFPEDLIQKYVRNFTLPGEWVFDPMAGTGSTLLAAAAIDRQACGIELNPKFAQIASSRFSFLDSIRLVVGDASDPASYTDIPEAIDYCITSPPYWDMLRMSGAETQAQRKAAGLQRWYSDDPRDLGNIADYSFFLDLLQRVYEQVALRLRPGRHLTVIVKNVKKKGVIYPLAWDIVERLGSFLIFAGEQIWCQDDQRLAPFGYRFAWVSNTFHHYCLTFQKPAG